MLQDIVVACIHLPNRLITCSSHKRPAVPRHDRQPQCRRRSLCSRECADSQYPCWCLARPPSAMCKDDHVVQHPTMGVPASRNSASCILLMHQLASLLCRAAAEFASTSCDALERLISHHMQSDSPHGAPHRLNLQGNFTPVADECSPLPCSLETGTLPAYLTGMYVRNGPNEQYKSINASIHGISSSHLLDGDGMLHSVSFHGGKATYCCRYVHTSRFVQERSAGKALFPKVFSSMGAKKRFAAIACIFVAVLRHLLGLVDLTKGMGLVNTSVVFHHGKLLALGEDDLPYTFWIQSDGDIVNIGRYRFSSHCRGVPNAMTSHPKIDKETGEMIFFSYSIFSQPHLTFFRMLSNGTLAKESVPIPFKEPCMIHDFAITPHFVIFPESQIVFRPLRVLQGRSLIVCDPRKVQRFGVLPRNARDGSKLRWFDVPGCNCFHIINAWEETEMAHLHDSNSSSSHVHSVAQIVLVFPDLSNPEVMISGQLDKLEGTLTEVRLDLGNGRATQRTLMQGGSLNVEMGTKNENYRGVKNRYVYMGVVGSSPVSLSGLVKVDLETRMVVSRRTFTDKWYASEPMFVSALPAPIHASFESRRAEEDEGCLLCFLHCESATSESTHADAQSSSTCTMLVLDAQSPTLETIASIKIPRRIPYGFHGHFIPQDSLLSV